MGDALNFLARLLHPSATFNNYLFVFIFLPIVLLGYWLVPQRRAKLAWVTAASFLFYGLWDMRFVPLLGLSALANFAFGAALANRPARKAWLVASIVFNLGVLGVFKYAGFAVDNARSLMDILGLPGQLPGLHIVLPVGISFYTFQGLSYVVDVYRRTVQPARDPLVFAAYLTMFPQLVAGPIVRYSQVDEQLAALPRWPRGALFYSGFVLFCIGLFKKVAVADTVAAAINPLWDAPQALTLASSWTAVVGYTLQLYFDFSGYSDMAIGLGAMLGLVFPVNFRAPYQARNPSDFWRRWHITLSQFIRDYLYIPMGGNRASGRRVAVNLLAAMTLAGLWHGAAWTFVVWGFYHGVLLLTYRRWGAAWDHLPVLIQRVGMLVLVMLGWVVFRAPDLRVTGTVLHALFAPAALGSVSPMVAIGLLLLLGYTAIGRPAVDRVITPSFWRSATTSTLLVACIVLMGEGTSPFLYYRF